MYCFKFCFKTFSKDQTKVLNMKCFRFFNKISKG